MKKEIGNRKRKTHNKTQHPSPVPKPGPVPLFSLQPIKPKRPSPFPPSPSPRGPLPQLSSASLPALGASALSAQSQPTCQHPALADRDGPLARSVPHRPRVAQHALSAQPAPHAASPPVGASLRLRVTPRCSRSLSLTDRPHPAASSPSQSNNHAHHAEISGELPVQGPHAEVPGVPSLKRPVTPAPSSHPQRRPEP